MSRVIDRKFWEKSKKSTIEFLTHQTEMIKKETKRLNGYKIDNPYNLEGLEFDENENFQHGEIEAIIEGNMSMFEHITKHMKQYYRDAPKETKDYLTAMQNLDKAIHRHQPDWPVSSS